MRRQPHAAPRAGVVGYLGRGPIGGISDFLFFSFRFYLFCTKTNF
jgi:hypothetical protein